MKKVLIVQALVKQYRKPFYVQLTKSLSEVGIELRVAYGEPSLLEQKKRDNVELTADLGLKVKNHWFKGGRLLYQPVLRESLKFDLVIVEQANKHLINPLLILLSKLGLIKIAFWGHGKNRQEVQFTSSEWLKKKNLGLVDWWFAYTAGAADYVSNCGFPSGKITVVQNSVDTSSFKETLSVVSDVSLSEVRTKLNFSEKTKVALYCGALYEDKKLDFLVDSMRLAREKGDDLRLIVMGAGPQREKIENYAEDFEWLHYVGPCFGEEKALYFRLADVFANPGLVGLSILDAFAAGLPFLTTDIKIHSPEVEYLEKGYNGEMTPFEPSEFADCVTSFLADSQHLEEVSVNALKSSETYSMAAMVANYANGITKCLGLSIDVSACESPGQ